MSAGDTIFALASGRLPSGVAVIRVSGPHVRFGLETICGATPEPRFMKYTAFKALDGTVLDHGLVVFFENPHSFTGEDCAELHLHGGVAVVRAVLAELAKLDGFRHAEAGEFTRRAFISGKLDLTQAEGLADLISAETEAQRRLAVEQADGKLKSLYLNWRTRLIRSRAMVEASIDFSDEDDVAERALRDVARDIALLRDEISKHLRHYRSSEIIREGYQVVIVGAPNAGKSSLLNAMTQRDVAIASDEAGTTRDLIEVRLEIDGNLIVLTDTAGIRASTSMVELIGIERAKAKLLVADLCLVVVDLVSPQEVSVDFTNVELVTVGTHSDLHHNPSGVDFALSTVSGDGVALLLQEIGIRAAKAVGAGDIGPARERQASLLKLCLRSLDDGDTLATLDSELIAERLRIAADYLGELSGVIGVEDLLEVIFSQFCIGK